METRKVYRAFRSYFPRIPAADALKVAREVNAGAFDYSERQKARFDLSPGRTVFWRPTEYPRHGAVYGPRLEDERGRRTSERFVESTERAGLRFVGHADELAGRAVDHTGWYTDDDGICETYRGAVWQLPARDGSAVYVAGYSDPNNAGAALIDFDPIYGAPDDYDGNDAKRDAAMRADDVARIHAERERDYRRLWDAAQRVRDLRESIASARAEHSELASELRAVRAEFPTIEAPRACQALRLQLANLRARVREYRREIAELIDNYGADILADKYA